MNKTNRRINFFKKPKPRVPGTGKKSKKNTGTRTIFTSQMVKSRGFLMMLVLFVFILILAFFFGEGGLIEIIKTRSRIDELKENILQLEKEKNLLVKEIEDLKKNPMALEKKAREKLWLMKKNEKVVVIVHDTDGKKKVPPKKSPRQ